jgi:ubiquinone/menaquinone biosynthesis C-methylase UbiE
MNYMQRIPEPELMEDAVQAAAYDNADFSESHGQRVALFAARYGKELAGEVLDLGCGSGDILERFAKRYPAARFTGVDGSAAMLELSRRRMEKAGVAARMTFVETLIPSVGIPPKDYAVVMGHSLLHHLHKPEVLWDTVNNCARDGTFIFIADLRRPHSREAAARIVDALSAGEPEVLRRDFFNSLLAAFTAEEVKAQLREAGLPGLTIEETGDIHLLVYGSFSKRAI